MPRTYCLIEIILKSFAKYTAFMKIAEETLNFTKQKYMQSIEKYFYKTNPEELQDNFFKAIGSDWLLITAGVPEKFNTMTASWGSIGVLWNKQVAICFIRPTRYTYGFADNNDFFTLSFFTEAERKILQFCGSKSGKDVDKIAITGLKSLVTANNAIAFEQARLCLECRKIYSDDVKPENFLIDNADSLYYPKKDYHRIFIGEIVGCYRKIEK
jgi:flavin reductase (DIM6/NTAB) family NADH-FMN oxidoreductase RutF